MTRCLRKSGRRLFNGTLALSRGVDDDVVVVVFVVPLIEVVVAPLELLPKTTKTTEHDAFFTGATL
jgi:hypothetical protein